MKYSRIKIIIILIVIMIFPFDGYSNQNQIAHLKNKFVIDQQNEVEYYQYIVGDKLNVSFLDKCSLFIGRIENFREQKVDLLIEKHLWGDKIIDNKIQLSYTAPRPNFRFTSEVRSPWDYVDVKEGNRLFVSQCKTVAGSQKYRIIVSKEELFPTIKEIIAYRNRIEKDSNILLEAPQKLDKQDNFVFASYIASRLWRGRFKDSDTSAQVLTQLLVNKNVPSFLWGFIRIRLTALLAKESEGAISSPIRHTVISGLVNIASSESKAADQTITLFLELSGKGKINIKPFLNKEKREKLILNYQNYKTKHKSQQGHKEFESQLSE